LFGKIKKGAEFTVFVSFKNPEPTENNCDAVYINEKKIIINEEESTESHKNKPKEERFKIKQ